MLYRDTYLEIDLDALNYNIKSVLAYKNTDFAFVVKGNAYGLGVKMITKELNKYDKIKYICVSTLNEALQIENISTKPIWIIGYLNNELIQIANQHDFVVSVYSLEQSKLLKPNSRIFINVNTGFNRLGKKPTSEYFTEIMEILSLKSIKVLGLYTHLGLHNVSSDTYQIESFRNFKNQFDTLNVKFEYYSISDSIGLIRRNNDVENLIRVGALMYGLTQTKDQNKIDVKPIFSLKTRISKIHTLEKDEFVGYSDTLIPKSTRVATLSIGYVDGLFRTMGKSYILYKNKHLNYLGILGMDNAMIDVTNTDLQENDILTVFGKDGLDIELLSTILETNKNELLGKLSYRIPRVYYKKGKVIKIVDHIVGD